MRHDIENGVTVREHSGHLKRACPMIHQLVQPPLAAITGSHGFMYEMIPNFLDNKALAH